MPDGTGDGAPPRPDASGTGEGGPAPAADEDGAPRSSDPWRRPADRPSPDEAETQAYTPPSTTPPGMAWPPAQPEPWSPGPADSWSPTTPEPWSPAPSGPDLPPAGPPGPPWTPPPAPPGRDGGSNTFRVAFFAAILSSLLTAALGVVLFRVVLPPAEVAATASPSVPASPAASIATVVSPSPASSASAAPSPSPFPSAGATASVAAGGTPPASTVTAIVRAALPSVVTITTQSNVGGRFGLATGVGSGIIFDSSGWILTNGHVVDGADQITVQLQDGRQLDGTVYGMASATDLAIVKVDATGLPALGLDVSSALALGDEVVAIGTPLGDYPGSVTNGIVSGLSRSITIRGLGTLDGLIQTDAAVNPGNSGGPLLDAAGRVVGIVTATSDSAQGISFAIPIDVARPYMADALAGKPLP